MVVAQWLVVKEFRRDTENVFVVMYAVQIAEDHL